jgi:seryl-tRNA synthetase
LSADATVRRIGDGELVSAASQVAATSDQLKKSLDNDLTKDARVSKAARQAAVAEADQLTKDAKVLRDRVKDANPSSAEASKLLAQASKVQAFVVSHQVPASAGAWKAATGYMQVVANAYGASWPR